MNTPKLSLACETFAKLAQQLNTKMNPAQKKEVDLWSNTLLSAFRGTGTYLYSPAVAKKIFDGIAAYKKAPAYGDASALKTIESLLAALTLSKEKLKGLGLDPAEVLKKKGVQNVSSTSIDILETNLETLRDASNFAAYRHYYIGPPGAPKEIIELDEPEIKRDEPGY
jgi:hypothetical protein